MYDGTEHIFAGRSLNELVDQLATARPTATALSQSSAAYERISGELDQTHVQLRGAMNQARAAHQGPAAEASQQHTRRQAVYADEATVEAGSARGAMANQSQHHADTMARMPQPTEEPALWRTITIALDPSHSYLVELRDYTERRLQAVDAMNNYQGATNSTVRDFALFAAPTTAPVGLGEAGGTANPGFPGGGGGSAGGFGGGSTGGAPAGGGGGSAGGFGGGSTGGAPAGGGGGGAPAGGVPVVPQGVQPLPGAGLPPGAGSAGRGSTAAGSGLPPPGGGPSTALTPLRPRSGQPGAWSGGGPAAGGVLRPGGGPGSGTTAAQAAGKGTPAAGRSGGAGMPLVPLGMGGGGRRGEQERRRPPWLVEDDPEAVFGPAPPHVAPVLEGTDDRQPR